MTQPRDIAQARYNAMPAPTRKAFEDLCESLNTIPTGKLTQATVTTFDVFANSLLVPFGLLVSSSQNGSDVSIEISPLGDGNGEEKEISGSACGLGGEGSGSSGAGSSGS